MTNITQQEIIEIAVKSGVHKSDGMSQYFDDKSENSHTTKEAFFWRLTKFAQLIEARLAARSDDRQSADAIGYLVPDYAEVMKVRNGHTLMAKDKTELHSLPVYLAAPQQAIPAIDVNKMVDRFLGWKLPSDFSPDAGINFNKLPHLHDSHEWPIGTNLLTAPQAKAMFEYCIHYQSDFDLEYTAKRIRRLLNALDIPDPSNGNDNTLMGCLFSLLGQACGKLESAAPTAPIEAQQSVREALEAAAKVCDEFADNGYRVHATECAERIRALIPSTQAPKDES